MASTMEPGVEWLDVNQWSTFWGTEGNILRGQPVKSASVPLFSQHDEFLLHFFIAEIVIRNSRFHLLDDSVHDVKLIFFPRPVNCAPWVSLAPAHSQEMTMLPRDRSYETQH